MVMAKKIGRDNAALKHDPYTPWIKKIRVVAKEFIRIVTTTGVNIDGKQYSFMNYGKYIGKKVRITEYTNGEFAVSAKDTYLGDLDLGYNKTAQKPLKIGQDPRLVEMFARLGEKNKKLKRNLTGN